VWGKSLDEIKQSFEMDGATLVKIPAPRKSSGLGQSYRVEGSASGIKEFEYHPGGGTAHQSGAPYYKIVKSDGTQIRIIDTNNKFLPGEVSSNQIYLNTKGQKLKYEQGTWMIIN
jgi:filamentous hemagglutinin